jgi:CHAT domain-containing protein
MNRLGSGAAAVVAALTVCLAPAGARQATVQQPAQIPPPVTAQDVDALLSEAHKLLRSYKFDDARMAFERTLEAAERLALEPQQAAALCGAGQALAERSQPKEAHAYGLRCLARYERLSSPRGIGEANTLLGFAAESLGNAAEAETHARRAIEAFDTAGDLRGRGRATVNLIRVGRMDVAEKDRLLARAIDDTRTAGDPGGEASALHLWGDNLFASGRYEDAFEKLEHAARLYEKAGAPAALGTVFNSLGRVYRAHGQLAEALRLQQKALALHETVGNPLLLVQSLNAVAVVHGFLGHLKESRDTYERALAIAEKSSPMWVQDFLRANIAALLSDLGEFSRAAGIFEEVIARNPQSYPSVRQTQLSGVRRSLGQTREALAAAERAVSLCGTAVTDCIAALRGRAQAHAAAGDRAAALADINLALGRIEDVRKQLVPADFFKQEFHRARERVYSEAIALNLAEHQDARALETAELARSRAFLDLLAARTGAPAESSLVLRGSQAAPSPADLRSSVAAQPAVMSDVAAAARRLGSTFLLYWVADDAVVTWVITPEGRVQSRRTGVLRSKLDELIRATSPLAESDKGTAALTIGAWRQLYDLLVHPVRGALPKAPGSLVTIVPHGPLQSLSFAALRDARGRYLLEDYTIHYAPSASIFQFTASMKKPAGREGGVLLVADPVLPTRSRLDAPLPRLPGARTEADAIARLLPRSRVTALRDAQATETGVRDAARDKAILHFATHAIVRDDNPFGSFLALAPGGADADGLLTAQEVYGWHLSADLIVLSACRSGGGRVTGDGVATFARAFMYAGTPSVVASLWDVADEPTNRLLPAFYRAWFGGQSKARALRSAQLALLRDLRAGKVQLKTPAGLVTLPEHPVFWAGFALIGEAD